MNTLSKENILKYLEELSSTSQFSVFRQDFNQWEDEKVSGKKEREAEKLRRKEKKMREDEKVAGKKNEKPFQQTFIGTF